MLQVAKGFRKDANGYDRRKRQGVSASSDIWSLGCLLYELVTGQYLYSGQEFGGFFVRAALHNNVRPDWHYLDGEKGFSPVAFACKSKRPFITSELHGATEISCPKPSVTSECYKD